jgi:proteic killer suppression protein/toxin YoeB
MISIDVSYANSKVEQYFTDFDRMKRKIGSNETKTIKLRMNQISASISFLDYLSLRLGSPHALRANLSDHYGVTITGNIRLIIRPLCDDRKPETLKNCTNIEVKGVLKYHEGKEEWLIK